LGRGRRGSAGPRVVATTTETQLTVYFSEDGSVATFFPVNHDVAPTPFAFSSELDLGFSGTFPYSIFIDQASVVLSAPFAMPLNPDLSFSRNTNGLTTASVSGRVAIDGVEQTFSLQRTNGNLQYGGEFDFSPDLTQVTLDFTTPSSSGIPFNDASPVVFSGTLGGRSVILEIQQLLSGVGVLGRDFGQASANTVTIDDGDNDEIPDPLDNCPDDPNTDQADIDSDGIGDVCDPFPNDACHFIGFLPRTTPMLAAFQDNTCEDWAGVSQPSDDLQSAVLTKADLSLANFNGALLANATLLGASLDGASLVNTNLTNAVLDSAILTNADLSFANLIGADLSNADLTSAVLTSATLTGALYDEYPVSPSGHTYDLPRWDLPNHTTPWNAGMKPAPEPSFGLMILFGAMGLAGLARLRGGMGWKRRGDQ
jgi:hypothetical protein